MCTFHQEAENHFVLSFVDIIFFIIICGGLITLSLLVRKRLMVVHKEICATIFRVCLIWDLFKNVKLGLCFKLMSPLIISRQTISFVSDHWLNFKTYYGPLAPSASLERLQLEFDQLFMRATYTILTAQKWVVI